LGDKNQIALLKHIVPAFNGPILEIGSRVESSNTTQYQSLFPGNEYVGVDMQEGTNVDFVIDLTEGTGELKEDYFKLIICASVLEHVKYPWLFAANITKLLKPGGLLYMSVPWIWRYHMYPDDYFRYSPAAIKEVLFPDLEWGKFYGSLRPTDNEGFFEIINFKGFDTTLGDEFGLSYRNGLKPMMISSLGVKSNNKGEENVSGN